MEIRDCALDDLPRIVDIYDLDIGCWRKTLGAAAAAEGSRS